MFRAFPFLTQDSLGPPYHVNIAKRIDNVPRAVWHNVAFHPTPATERSFQLGASSPVRAGAVPSPFRTIFHGLGPSPSSPQTSGSNFFGKLHDSPCTLFPQFFFFFFFLTCRVSSTPLAGSRVFQSLPFSRRRHSFFFRSLNAEAVFEVIFSSCWRSTFLFFPPRAVKMQ